MSHIFISYSREDQFYAGRLADDIRQHGFDVWIDDRIDFGDRWFEEIELAIIGCDAVVVIMSPAARRSKWVQREILIADRDNKPLFPLLLEGREFGNLIDIQFADVRGGSLPQQDFYDRLAAVRQPAKQSGRWVVPREITAATRRFPCVIGLVVMLLVFAIGLFVLNNDGEPIATSTATDDSELAIGVTDTPTSTFTSTPTILPPLVAAVEGVEANAGWTPYLQDVNGYPMALVPRGCFRMGSVSGDVDETPTAQVCLDAPFWIDVTEVTNTQYGSFGLFRGADRPRDTVTWFAARDFCAGRGGRLPSEAEWEYAARGPNGLTFPWGNEFDAEQVVHVANSGGESVDVGLFPGGASWIGALGMSGNLWEWTGSIYRDYPYDLDDGREDAEPSDDAPPVLRGGSWTSDEFRLRASYRENSRPGYADEFFGFRCVVDFEG